MSSMVGRAGMATPAVSSVKGTGYNMVSVPNKSPEQMNLFSQGAQGLGQGFPDMLKQMMGMASGQGDWGALEAPAMRQFGELQGNIASRFSGMGMGARRGSGFQNAMGGAATDLAERLQSNRMGLQQNAQSQLMQMYQNLMGQDLSTNAFLEKPKSPFQMLMEGLGGAGSQALGQFGGLGAAKWAKFI